MTEINQHQNSTQQITEVTLEYLRSIVHFDSVVILGYKKGVSPTYLYSSSGSLLNVPFEKMFTGTYFLDPFYSRFSKACNAGVHGIEDVIQDRQELTAYREEFMWEHTRTDELAVCIAVDKQRWLVFYLRRSSNSYPFTMMDKQRIKDKYALLQRHCYKVSFDKNGTYISRNSFQGSLAQMIPRALTTFGAGQLSKREQEVAQLIIRGLDNKSIARKLDIKLATVKAHRKNIYTKMDITSLGEIFQLFLNHMIFYSYHPDLNEAA